ncbi:MAG TPA: CBS domain-containing protein [Burkholderiaceae bacterium]|nr:CBS domain-containing protein [Burkholderiaceae bacterium]
MFFVYGTAGQVFSGNLEKMAQVAGVSRSARVRAFRPTDVEHQFELPAKPSGAGREALAAYTQAKQNKPERQPLTRVADVMSDKVISVAQDATVSEGWQLLAHHRIAQAPVLDARGTLVGLLIRADLLQPELLSSPEAGRSIWSTLAEQPVSELMHTPVPAVAADTDIRRVAQALLDTGLPGLPVTDERGAVIGFVSRSDILRAVVADPPLDLWS